MKCSAGSDTFKPKELELRMFGSILCLIGVTEQPSYSIHMAISWRLANPNPLAVSLNEERCHIGQPVEGPHLIHHILILESMIILLMQRIQIPDHITLVWYIATMESPLLHPPLPSLWQVPNLVALSLDVPVCVWMCVWVCECVCTCEMCGSTCMSVYTPVTTTHNH